MVNIEGILLIVITLWLVGITMAFFAGPLSGDAMKEVLGDFMKKVPTQAPQVASATEKKKLEEEITQKTVEDMVGKMEEQFPGFGNFFDQMRDKLVDPEDEDDDSLSAKRKRASAKGLEARRRKKMEQMFEDAKAELITTQDPIASAILSKIPIVGPFLEENIDFMPLAIEMGRPIVEGFLPRMIERLPYSIRNQIEPLIQQYKDRQEAKDQGYV